MGSSKKAAQKNPIMNSEQLVIFYRLPADLNPAGKSNKTLWRHLFFLICGPNGQSIKLRIMSYSEIVVRGQNLQFQVICQNMAMFEQLNDKLLVDSKKVWSLKRL